MTEGLQCWCSPGAWAVVVALLVGNAAGIWRYYYIRGDTDGN